MSSQIRDTLINQLTIFLSWKASREKLRVAIAKVAIATRVSVASAYFYTGKQHDNFLQYILKIVSISIQSG